MRNRQTTGPNSIWYFVGIFPHASVALSARVAEHAALVEQKESPHASNRKRKKKKKKKNKRMKKGEEGSTLDESIL